MVAVSGSTVYAGGDFSTAGGVSATRIAKWNGSSWSAMGSRMNNAVLAIVVSGGTVYAGGDFSTAGGVSASRVGRWNELRGHADPFRELAHEIRYRSRDFTRRRVHAPLERVAAEEHAAKGAGWRKH